MTLDDVKERNKEKTNLLFTVDNEIYFNACNILMFTKS